MNCTVAPEDDLVIGHLHAPLAGVHRLDLVLDVTRGAHWHAEDVAFDPGADEVVMAPSVLELRQLGFTTPLWPPVSHREAHRRSKSPGRRSRMCPIEGPRMLVQWRPSAECTARMATENDSQQTESLTSLAARVKKLEEHESGWSLARVGILIGCLGGLIGGLSTLRQMWLDWSAQPHFEVVAESALNLYWEPQGRNLSITRNVVLQNTGDKVGSIPNPPVAQLESGAPLEPRTQFDISATANAQSVAFPLPIKASDAQNLTLTMSSQLPQDANPPFPSEGAYKLVFTLAAAGAAPDLYCFRLSPPLVDQLNSTGHLRMLHSDPCT